MSSLTVVYLKDTGHVLAALTRANPPAVTEPVTALVGAAGLPVSFIAGLPVNVGFPAGNLAAVTVNDRPDVVVTPQGYQVIQDLQSQAPPLVNPLGAAYQVTLAVTTYSATVAIGKASSPAGNAAKMVMVVLQKENSAAAIFGPDTVVPGSDPTTIVGPAAMGPGIDPAQTSDPSPAIRFAPGETWTMYAFVQGLLPTAQTFRLSDASGR